MSRRENPRRLLRALMALAAIALCLAAQAVAQQVDCYVDAMVDRSISAAVDMPGTQPAPVVDLQTMDVPTRMEQQPQPPSNAPRWIGAPRPAAGSPPMNAWRNQMRPVPPGQASLPNSGQQTASPAASWGTPAQGASAGNAMSIGFGSSPALAPSGQGGTLGFMSQPTAPAEPVQPAAAETAPTPAGTTESAAGLGVPAFNPFHLDTFSLGSVSSPVVPFRPFPTTGESAASRGGSHVTGTEKAAARGREEKCRAGSLSCMAALPNGRRASGSVAGILGMLPSAKRSIPNSWQPPFSESKR